MASRLFALFASLALLSLLIPSAYGKTASFHVEQGSNNIYFAVNIKYDGVITAVALKQTNPPYSRENGWLPFTHNFGTVWRFDPKDPTMPPFSIQITDSQNNKFVAKDVIPPNWKPNTVYTANLVRA
ncbi:Expansin B1 [Rhynchospora pubera]|uniref:Expansin B1 n=1 Tax=Rhynchospora pubera TaxID=906938 RepID=A0AAV8GBI9_9POAL|nr:Expansin B1 [Rhynchospora pubera]KAJ4803060.1 Expansin B1 [Rhynchospora pubera]